MEFAGFPKVPRLNRDVIITEKLDGTNAQICIVPFGPVDYEGPGVDYSGAIDVDFDRGLVMFAGSRKRYIQPGNDNYGFARWALDHAEELYRLGPGRHFGEWWGKGIQRGYGLDNKRFSLFNTGRWTSWALPEPDKEQVPQCCHVVPILYEGQGMDNAARNALGELQHYGSVASPGFMTPEGIMVYHTAANMSFKVTIKNDEEPKGGMGLYRCDTPDKMFPRKPKGLAKTRGALT